MLEKIYRTAVCVMTTPIAVITGAAMMYRLSYGGYDLGLEEQDII